MEGNAELAHCALLNFENAANAMPVLRENPFFKIAMMQLNEALN